jgi:hypothetical protein
VVKRNVRRVGQKAISVGRTHTVLERKLGIVTAVPAPQKRLKINYAFKRWHAAVPLAILLIIGGTYGYQKYTHSQAVAAQQRAHNEEIKRREAVASQEESCRRQKMAAKADKIGTITYADLYNGECWY